MSVIIVAFELDIIQILLFEFREYIDFLYIFLAFPLANEILLTWRVAEQQQDKIKMLLELCSTDGFGTRLVILHTQLMIVSIN